MAGGDLEARCDQIGGTTQLLERKSWCAMGITELGYRQSVIYRGAPDDAVFRMRACEVFLVAQGLQERANVSGRVSTASALDECGFEQPWK